MITVVVGTRPEIIKMAPVVKALRESGTEHDIVHTGQHYDARLSEVFFDELELQRPDAFLEVGSGSQAEQTAKAMVRIEKRLVKTCSDAVLVQGDTNTVLAGALAGAKLGIPVGHVEAGLRSYDLRMPEEHNRRVADHLSALLFAPTANSARILRSERVWGAIHVTGNTVIDACVQYARLALKRSKIAREVEPGFALVTAHRAENVDDPKVLKAFVEAFCEMPYPVVYPVHPRTMERLRKFRLLSRLERCDNVTLLPPAGYLDFLALMQRCAFIMTDSGGVQEEATAPSVRKRVLVLRTSTERPEAVKSGFAQVVGVEKRAILKAVKLLDTRQPRARSPYGDGKAGRRIAKISKEAAIR